MMQVIQKFYCDHPKGKNGDVTPPGYPNPVEVKSKGHTFTPVDQYCVCTGKVLKMRAKIEWRSLTGVGPH